MSMHAIRWKNASCSAVAAVLLALGASAAEGPAVAARLVRFATWSAEGASSPNRLESFAHSARDTPLATNGCEAVFIVKAADKTRSVTGFDEDAFKLVSAQTDDGRDLLSDDPAEKVDWDVEVLPPDKFRISISPLAKPFFGLVRPHGRLVALISPSNVTESVTLSARIGERARLDVCSLRLRPDAFAGALSFFGNEDEKEKSDGKPSEHLVLEVRAPKAVSGDISVSSDGKTILKKALGAASAAEIEMGKDGHADLSNTTMSFQTFSTSSGTGMTKSESYSIVHTLRFEKPASGSLTVSFLHPATPERVPLEF